jgi:hypothetical protein
MSFPFKKAVAILQEVPLRASKITTDSTASKMGDSTMRLEMMT